MILNRNYQTESEKYGHWKEKLKSVKLSMILVRAGFKLLGNMT